MYFPVYMAALICGFLIQNPADFMRVGLGFLIPAQFVKTVVVAFWGEPFSHDLLVSDVEFWTGSLIVSGFWIGMIALVWSSRLIVRKVRGV